MTRRALLHSAVGTVCLLLARLAHAAPGIDLSANNICPGVAGASSSGGNLDCAALAAAGRYVSIYGTFIPAESISDLSALDGEIDAAVDETVPSGTAAPAIVST